MYYTGSKSTMSSKSVSNTAAPYATGTLAAKHAAFVPGDKVGTQCVYTADGRLVCPSNAPRSSCASVSPACWINTETGTFQCSPAQPACTSAAECAKLGINGMTVYRR